MPRLTVTFNEDLYEWIEAEAERRDRPKAWIIKDAVRGARGGGDHHIGDHRTDDHRTDALRETVAELADRVSELETAVGADHVDAVDSDDATASAGDDETGDTGGTQAPRDARDDGAGDRPPTPATAAETGQRPADVSAEVWTTVLEMIDSWADTEERLQARREAAAVALGHAVSTGEAIGKSDAIETWGETHAVDRQSPETWWRKNIRPILSEVGDYSQASHGYVVDELPAV